MKSDKLIYFVFGVFVCAMIIYAGHDLFWPKAPDKPEKLGDLEIKAVIRPESLEVRIEQCNYQRPIGELEPLEPQWHDFVVKHETFGIKGSILGLLVDSIKIEKVEYRGKAEVMVLDGDIAVRPVSSGLHFDYKPRIKLYQREPWCHFEICAGASLQPPFVPLVGFGVGLERIGKRKLPPLTFWYQQIGSVGYGKVSYRWEF